MATPKSLENAGFIQSNNIIRASKISNTQILLNLQKGAFNPDETWFVKDEDDKEFVVIPQNVLKKIVMIMRNAHEEKVCLELARDVSQSTPIDFDDVMAVALNELESRRLSDGSLPNVNTKELVKDLKKSYPNLFFDIAAHFMRKESND